MYGPTDLKKMREMFEPRPEPQPKRRGWIPTYARERRTPLDKYAPCPCGSAKKVKFCCGLKA